MSADADGELRSMLRRRIENDPEGLIRDYPDRALAYAERARAAGHASLADEIEQLVAEVQEDGT